MTARLAACLCFLGLGCGQTLTVYHRTSPRRVEISKQTSPPVLTALAIRNNDGAIELHLKRSTRVILHRVLHYNSAATIYDHSGSVWNEAYELFVAVTMLWLPGIIRDIAGRIDGENTPTRKLVRRRGLLLALFDPTTSVFSNNIRIEPIVREQVFSDPPTERDYEIRLPAADMAISYRLLDDAGREIAGGSGRADRYGVLALEASFDQAIAVEVAMGDRVVVVPIQSGPSITSAATTEPAPARSAVAPPPLARQSWTHAQLSRHLLPRIGVMLDVARLASSEVMLLSDLRLARKLSVGAIASRHAFSYDLPSGGRETQIERNIGAYLRWFLVGDVGTGLHVGIEGLRGFTRIEPGPGSLDLASLGVTVGYKYTFDFGLTLDIVAGERDLTIDDPSTPGLDVSGLWLFSGHLAAGWSF